jgi:hypothetical protein
MATGKSWRQCLQGAFGNFAGGVMAELKSAPARALSIALHAATGAAIALVGVDLTQANRLAGKLTKARPYKQ